MLNEEGFIVGKKGRVAEKLSPQIRAKLKPVQIMTDEELMNVPNGSIFMFDVECYKNFFFVAFKCVANCPQKGKFVVFEQSPDATFNTTKLLWMMWRFCNVGFNSASYDIPMIQYAATGAGTEDLKRASDFIIKSGINYGTKKVTPFDFEKKYGVRIPKYNNIDLFNVCPVNGGVTANPASLKLYAARLHCERLQDLPYPEDALLTQEEAEVLRLYCCNDLENTELLFNELSSEIKLRIEMSSEYGVDLRSKSDAQIAEAVINSELEKVLGHYPKKPTIANGTILQYNLPNFIKFKSKALQDVLQTVLDARFELDAMGAPVMPETLDNLTVRLGKSTYKLGMGGLHSNEKNVYYTATAGMILADNDVESFYPKIILNLGLFPPHLGEAFLIVYEAIVNRRVDAKHKAKALKAIDKIAAAGFKTIADTLKIVINGSFGKLGNKYSTLYAPQLMLQVTITGQLALLMLIEMIEEIGVSVISGNTDGFISYYHESRHEEVRAVIKQWEEMTNFKTEETQYLGVYSRDVNSYVAIKAEQDKKTGAWLKTPAGDPEARFLDERLGCKTKGFFSERGSALNSILSKNPEAMICVDAVLEYLVNKVPIEKTIKSSKDIRRFVSIRNVKGGGQKNGIYLGKVVRWYYAKGEPGYVSYVSSRNKVAKSEGAKPIMDLPSEFVEDIDYKYYEKEALDLLYDLGVYKKATTASLFD